MPIPNQTKKKMEEFVKEESKKLTDPFSQIWRPPDSYAFELALHRAITFGLELAKDAGPVKMELLDLCSEHPAAFQQGCEWCQARSDDFIQTGAHNNALTAKNAAIQELIDGMKI